MVYLKIKTPLHKSIKFFGSDWSKTMYELTTQVKKYKERYIIDSFCDPLERCQAIIIKTDILNPIKISPDSLIDIATTVTMPF
jgi:hypothetical protein